MSHTKKSVYRPKWLDETKRDARTINNTNAYVTKLKKNVREAAGILYTERGGKNALYLMLRDAYFGSDVNNDEK
jgi:hypothetical protein